MVATKKKRCSQNKNVRISFFYFSVNYFYKQFFSLFRFQPDLYNRIYVELYNFNDISLANIITQFHVLINPTPPPTPKTFHVSFFSFLSSSLFQRTKKIRIFEIKIKLACLGNKMTFLFFLYDA